MLKFGVIAEGATDQTVIENILRGYFEQTDNLVVNPIQPPPAPGSPAGWTNVFHCLARRDYEGALPFIDYLIIHIDTDVQEEPGFNVPRREDGKELGLKERVDRVIARLKREMDGEFLLENAHRLLFAIAVDTIECWLLPLLCKDKRKARKMTGCLKAANQGLRTANCDLLTGKDPVPAYDKASSGYRKRKTLLQLHDKNPSLELFIKQLGAIHAG